MSYQDLTAFLTGIFQSHENITAGNVKAFFCPDNGYIFTRDELYFLDTHKIRTCDIKGNQLLIKLFNGDLTALQLAA